MTKYIVMQIYKATGKNPANKGETLTLYLGKDRSAKTTNLVEMALEKGFECKRSVARKLAQAEAEAKRAASHGEWEITTFLVEVIS